MDKSVSLNMIKSFNRDCHSDSSLKCHVMQQRTMK